MADFGITDQGFNRKTLADIVDDLNEKWRAAFGASIDTSDESPLGQFTGTFAAELAEAWEICEEAYQSANPDAVTGFSLVALCALSGTSVREAAGTRVLCTVNLDAGTTLPAGTLASIAGRDDLQFALEEAVVGFASGPPADILNTVWVCTQTGPIACNANTLTEIVTPVAGWNSIENPADGARGRNIDTWEELRERREAELANRGGSTLNAIRAAVLQVAGVDACTVIENSTDTNGYNGLPRKSFEVLIDDGAVPAADDDEVAQAIWNSKPAGIQAYGGFFGEAVDELGDVKAVAFTRVTRVRVYVSATLATNTKFPSDGVDQAKEKILAAGATFEAGDDVTALILRAASLAVSGVTDVPAFAMGLSPSPVSDAPIAIGARSRASFDSGDITIS
jgi:uncharacterized phage protein gp47/JayE